MSGKYGLFKSTKTTCRACTRSARCRRDPGSRLGVRRRLGAEELRVVGRPARRRDLDHPDVVEGALLRVEVRDPSSSRSSSGRADRVRVAGVGDVHRVAHGRQLAVFASGLRSPDHDDVVDLLVSLALGVEPALDHLDAVEVRAVGVAQRADQERRRLALRAPRPGRRPSARPSGSRTSRSRAARRRPARSRSRRRSAPSAACRWSHRLPCAPSRPTAPRACSRSPRPLPDRRRWSARHIAAALRIVGKSAGDHLVEAVGTAQTARAA